jgi:regulator of sigma E protease
MWVMALISINLGLLNLLPIPVLDGGHLMFFALEGIMRRPLPLRVRELAHIVGMTILLALMALAFKNDVERRWDVIVGQVRELFG